MLQNLVLGTLATVNAMLTPLAKLNDRGPSTFHIQVNNQRPACEMLMIEKMTDTYFEARFSRTGCGLTGLHAQHAPPITLDLPTELIDAEFLQHLSDDLGYVIQDLPSDVQPGRRVRMKITKLIGDTRETPFLVEWLPSPTDARPEHEPMTIWMSTAWLNKGKQSQLIWRRVQLAELNVDAMRAAPEKTLRR